MESIAAAELKKTLQSSKISEQEAEAIHKMADSLINKILHDPTLFLKQNGMREDKSFYIDTVRKLFKLDE
jgi:glutamyl-tRNA reductase